MQPETQQSPQVPQAGWQFHNEGGQQPQQTAPPADEAGVIWTASEYISHGKTNMWYVRLGLITAVATALAFFITRDIVVAITLVVVGVIFGVVAGRKPRVLNYAVDDHGIIISQNAYPYGLFKSFSVIQEGSLRSIYLMPIKRFNPPLSLYYPPEEEQQIVGIIGNHLPQEAREQDAIDRLMHKIRF